MRFTCLLLAGRLSIVFAACVAAASPAVAQQTAPSQPWPSATTTEVASMAEIPQVPVRDQSRQLAPIFPAKPIEEPQRPSALLPLYGSLVALQGLDIHSTRGALEAGEGREANPAMRPVVRNSAAFIAVKAGATAGVIWASEKMWKKNRKAAVVFATVVNVAMAAIVANNYRVSR
jgi:hypothetical protein